MKNFAIRIIFLLLCFVSINYAQTESSKKLILLVDKSGSLKKHDPQDLRKDALKFLIEQNNYWDEIALYSFGSSVKTNYPTTHNIFYNSITNKEELLQINNDLSRDDNLTDLEQGLLKVYDDLTRFNSWDNIRILIFTDAQLQYGDIPKDVSPEDYRLRIYDAARRFAEKNIPIDGIAFTKIADITYLQTIASLTNGFSRKAPTPEIVNQIITELLTDNLKGPLSANKEIELNVSSLVSSFKILAFNQNTSTPLPTIKLFDPQGNSESDYILATYKTSIAVEKNNPKQGIWKAIVSGADDVEVFYNKKINYEMIVNKPVAKELSLCKNSVVPFDVEVKSAKIENLVGTKCIILLIDSIGRTVQDTILEKIGSKFIGNMKIYALEGIYDLIIKISNQEDYIEKKFTALIDDNCLELDYEFSSDIVVNNPLLVSLTKTTDAQIEVLLYNPKNEKVEIELFDDGTEAHADNFANDGIFSNKISNLKEAGKYRLEISLTYEKEGIPIINKIVEDIYKIVSIEPDIIKASYPEESSWNITKEIKINNLTSYKIIIKELFPDDKYLDRIRITLSDTNGVILPREEKKITFSINGLQELKGEHQLLNIIYCDLVDPQSEEKRISNAKINLMIVLDQETPFSSILILIITLLLILVSLLILLGLFLIVPMRFKGVIYTGNLQEIGIGEFRKIAHPYVDLEDIGRIGISLLGYGYWYHKDTSNIVEKYFNNINLRKEKF